MAQEKLSEFNMQLLRNNTRLITKTSVVYEGYEYPNAKEYDYGFKLSPIEIDNNNLIGKTIGQTITDNHLIMIGSEINTFKHDIYGTSPKFGGEFSLISLEEFESLKDNFKKVDNHYELDSVGKLTLENISSKYISLIKTNLEKNGMPLENKAFNLDSVSKELYTIGQSFINKASFPKVLKDAGLKEKTSIFEEVTIYGAKNKDFVLAALMENKFEDKVAIESHSISPLGSESEVGKLSQGCTVFILVPKIDIPSLNKEKDVPILEQPISNDIKPKEKGQLRLDF